MTLTNLIKYLRESILYDTGGSGVDWTEIDEDENTSYQLRWTNEELTSYINEAQRVACRSAFLLKGNDSTFDITVVADTAEYTLDEHILRIKGAYLVSNGTELVPAEYEDLVALPKWKDQTGTPTNYITDMGGGKIRLYPTPEDSDTVTIIAYYVPLTDFDWIQADTQSSPLRQEHQIPMLNYAAHLAYLKDEANTFDPERSNHFLALFQKDFTDTSVYGDLRRARTSNRTVKYGGL